MPYKTTHYEQLEYLKKVEGQVRGLQNMIKKDRYCVDIITQIHSVIGALQRIENKLFKKHIKNCLGKSLSKGSNKNKNLKIEEVIKLIYRFRKQA
jgi:DNA-binding FrmR family transcriptional regulator